MTSLAAYLLLFTAVGIGFILVHLLAGKLIRPSKPDVEKGTIYECGEPTIGSAWIQFDLRFYVVALLFVIFDVEVAFFFPWAEVFGKANAIANTGQPTTAAEYRDYAEKILDLAPPVGSSDVQHNKEIRRYEEISKLTTSQLEKMKAEQEAARAKGPKERTKEESHLASYDGPLKASFEPNKTTGEVEKKDTEFMANRKEARELATLAFFEVLLFFGVLLVGFAYLWRRGDLAWVRSTLSEQPPPPVAPAPPPPEVSRPAVREHATVGAGGHS